MAVSLVANYFYSQFLVGHTCLSECSHHGSGTWRKHLRPTRNNFPQVVVIKRNQRQQLLMFLGRKIRAAPLKQPRQNQIVLQKTTTAAPAQFGELEVSNHNLYGPLHQHLFELANGACGVQSLRTHIHAIHDGVAAKQPIRIFEIVKALRSIVIAAVGDEPVRGE